MKWTKMSTAVLTAFVATTLVGGSSAFADAGEFGSTGKVTVEKGTAGGENQGTLDPEKPDPDKPITDPTVPTTPDDGSNENTNPTAGDLVIEKTSDLDFGTVKTSTNKIVQPAKAMSFENGAKKRGAYIQWADIRQEKTGYQVFATLSKQFTGTKGSLKGATIQYTNPFVAAQSDNDSSVKSSTSGFELAEGVKSDALVTADANEGTNGSGRFIMAFGKSSEDTTDKSVFLNIPAATASTMKAENYTATITWTIEATPAKGE